MTFHLHTESFPNLPSIIGESFKAFTLTQGIGYWDGQSETAAIIEIETDDYAKVFTLAETIRTLNGQNAVMVECYVTSRTTITGKPFKPVEPVSSLFGDQPEGMSYLD